MFERKKTIAVIPARGGSKRIPRKNIKDFLGKPILAYSVEAALRSEIFDEVMVSTDDEEIADVAMKYGAKVPFFRSKEMSNDAAMTVPVLIEVLNEYEKTEKHFEYLCCIYATAPFIASENLQNGMKLLRGDNVDSVLPVVKFSYPPQRGLIKDGEFVRMIRPENYNVRSQDLEPVYHDAGQFYCLNTKSLRKEQKMFCPKTLAIELPESEVQDIDTEEDWKMAELKYRVLKQIGNQ